MSPDEFVVECLPYSPTDPAARCVYVQLRHLTGQIKVCLLVDTGAEGLTLPSYYRPQLVLFKAKPQTVDTAEATVVRDTYIVPTLLFKELTGKQFALQQVPTQFSKNISKWNFGLLGANLLFRQGSTEGPLWQSVRFHNATNRLVFVP